MDDNEIKPYPTLFNKFCSLGETFLTGSQHDEDRRLFAVCLTEIFQRSYHLIELTKKVSEAETGSEVGLDRLLGDLVNLQIELYDEVFDWMTSLKDPLQNMIDAVEDKMG